MWSPTCVFLKRSGIGRPVVITIILVIIIVAGIGGYFALMSPSPGTSSSTTNTSRSTSSSSVSSSTGSSSSSTKSTSMSSTSSATTSLTCTVSTATTTQTSTTTTQSTTTQSAPSNSGIVRLLGNFSALTIHLAADSRNSTSGATYHSNLTSSYVVIYSPRSGASDFKVNFTQSYVSSTITGLVWIQPDGTIISVYQSGVNSTGNTALAEFLQLSANFQSEYFYGVDLQAYISLPGVHEINQTTVNLGPTTLMVTNYGITSPTGFCNGNGLIENQSFLVQEGTIPGTTLPLVSIWSESGSFTPAGSNSHLISSVTFKVLSVMKA